MTKRQKVYWDSLERSSKPEDDQTSLDANGEVDEVEVVMEDEHHDKTSK